MAGRFVSIKREDMATVLESRGFKLYPADWYRRNGCYKYVWAKLARKAPTVVIRVYSGINLAEGGGQSRGVGEDAIRVQAFTEVNGTVRSFGGKERVNRVPGWEQRLAARIEAVERLIGPPCPKCGNATKLREPKDGQTWRPFFSCVRFRRDSDDSCDGTVQADNRS